MKAPEFYPPDRVDLALAQIKRYDQKTLDLIHRVNNGGSKRFWTALGIGGATLAIGTVGFVGLVNATTSNQIPNEGYSDSILGKPTPKPRIVIEGGYTPKIIQESGISAGDYIHKSYESLHKKGLDGKSPLDYLVDSGYKILDKDRSFLRLVSRETGEVSENQKLEVLMTPVPAYDKTFKENVAGIYESKQKFPIYGVLTLYDPKLRVLTLFGLTSYLKDVKNPGWVIIGNIDQEGAKFYVELDLAFRENFLSSIGA